MIVKPTPKEQIPFIVKVLEEEIQRLNDDIFRKERVRINKAMPKWMKVIQANAVDAGLSIETYLKQFIPI